MDQLRLCNPTVSCDCLTGMASSHDQLTSLGDSTLLVFSTLGLICVSTAVLWIAGRSPDWGADEVKDC